MQQPSYVTPESDLERVNTFIKAIGFLSGELKTDGEDSAEAGPWPDATLPIIGVPATGAAPDALASAPGNPRALPAPEREGHPHPAGEGVVLRIAEEPTESDWMPTLAGTVRVSTAALASTSVHNPRRSVGGRRDLTRRDRAMLATIVELRLVTIPMLFEWFFADAVTPTVVNNWLRRMRHLRLMTAQPRVTASGHKVFRPTRQTYELLGIHGRPRELRSDEHTLCVAQTYLRLAADGWRVTSERCIALEVARDARDGERQVLTGHYWTKVGPSVHQPDLVIERNGGRWHVEVETTAKDQRRYDDLFQGFALSIAEGLIDGVTYVVADGGRVRTAWLEQSIAAAAARARKRLETRTDFGFSSVTPIPELRSRWWSVETVAFTWDRPVQPRGRALAG